MIMLSYERRFFAQIIYDAKVSLEIFSWVVHAVHMFCLGKWATKQAVDDGPGSLGE